MTPLPPVPAGRLRGRRGLAFGATLALALGTAGCGTEDPSASAPSTGEPVRVVHGPGQAETAAAAVVARHLARAGHPVTVADQPEAAAWSAAGGDTVAIVDTLALALAADPEAVLPQEDPEDEAARASAVPTPSPATLTPLDPDLPPRVPASPSAAAASPTPLADVGPAADTEAVRAIVDAVLARAAAGGAVAVPPSPSEGASPSGGASSSAAAASAPPDAPRVLSSSAGELRLAPILSAGTAARLKLDSVDDLNGRCEELAAALPAALAGGPGGERAAALLTARLDASAGCRPAEWSVQADPAGPALVRDEVGLAIDHSVDPDVPPHGLAVLEDGAGVLPAGRVAVVGSPRALDDGVEAALQEVMTALDEDGLRDLARVSTGPDALSPDDAAQYWLVTEGLEEAPEDWVVPVDGWF
ncbi:hypothetical protein [Micrococcus lacusdianchii]|uniref:hypothetical protein n=1 Tax=Micrococcus lacusdianchii TaxID=2915940 RepID=UPI0020043E6E|nr:hypothetical protein [Micrococcus sp. JXJ CY 30]